MYKLTKRLEKRGWKKSEIKKAVSIIKNAKQSKTNSIKLLEKHIYFILLIVVIAANFAISVALIPLLMALKGPLLYFIIIVLGIVFGLLFELVIRGMEHLEKKHHLILVIFIPSIALANVFVISKLSNDLTITLGFKNVHNPTIVALTFAISFVIPYIFYRFMLNIGYYSEK